MSVSYNEALAVNRMFSLNSIICEYPKEGRSIFSHQSVGFRFILVVEGVEIEMLFVSEETLAH